MGRVAVIVLDTHIWLWWLHDEASLHPAQIDAIRRNEGNGLGVSVISCWEVAKLAEHGRLTLPMTVESWFEHALAYPGIKLIDLTPAIAVESTRLPNFHRDPADQLIVATARLLGCPLVTSDEKIVRSGAVKIAGI